MPSRARAGIGIVKMSARVSGKVWELELDPTEKLVLLALADHADHEGNNVRPGNDLLVAKTGLSERTIGQKIASFIERGILEPENTKTGRGKIREFSVDPDRCTRRQYFIDRERNRAEKKQQKVEAGSTDTPSKGRSEFDRLNSERSNLAQQKVESDAEKVESDGKTYKEYEPSIEPSIEPSSSEPSAPGDLKPKKTDPLFAAFCERYQAAEGIPYLSKQADFVQLATLRKKGLAQNWEITPERFTTALRNYFASEITNYTLADLSSRFSVFFKNALDCYGKAKTKKQTSFSSGINAANSTPEEFAAEVQRIHEAKYGVTLEMETA